MAQVIEVRFVNPTNQEVLADRFTQTDSHTHAIDLAMDAWSGGNGVIKGIEQVADGKFIPGPNPCWRYVYRVLVEDDEYDREMKAVLFAQYKEKEETSE